ncbi:MAG: SpoIID/LytB domain-containing protein [Muribaculaceae bacterium]|nr:SpoIID/LytB domain-containing protein [Muribaculaceae bacterium]
MSTVNVGILSAPEIEVDFSEGYGVSHVRVSLDKSGAMLVNGAAADSVRFHSDSPDSFFTVRDVTIGVDFHWQRRENQSFRGNCRIILDEKGMPLLINEVDIEDYLRSVISSEMSATASLPLLKAHAVISRSWLLAQIRDKSAAPAPTVQTDTPDELVRWYDHSAHSLFDVCADDHCQRYQGITRQTTPTVATAVEETAGEVLMFGDQLCDARFSKCCGGVFEEFENCWQPVHHHYLVARRDSANPLDFPDLRRHDQATRWIESAPDAFCNTRDPQILSQVLNGYDQETADFYRWKVSYTQDELSELIRRRSGIDFGKIIALEPLERGTSGRIVRLKITGTRRSRIIGKELEIRRTLSASHLYSSAFTVHPMPDDADGIPTGFELHGAGWGHGAGLCQIGAAVMGALGYNYRDILSHYFPGAEIRRI